MIKVKILEDDTLKVNVGEIANVNSTAEYYPGKYDVTPNFDEQTLETKGLIMRNDVTVHAIPIESVSNSSGGKTIIIGG